MISAPKSSITFSKKTPMEVKIRVQTSLGITKEGVVGKYLGLPEHFGRRKKDMFTFIVDIIRQKAASWNTKKLSSTGKIVMLKSVISVKPTYAMTCFKLPLSLIKRIQSALTRFFWDANPDKRKICWIAFSELAISKGDGGIELRDIETFNLAMLAKLSCRIYTRPDCLLARVLLGKYCKFQPFSQVSATSSISHGWRSILCGRDLLMANTGKAIGNGRDTLIWEEPWLSSETPSRPMGPPPSETKNWRVYELMIGDSGEWNRELIGRILPTAATEILSIPKKDGVYSTKTGYYTNISMKEATQLQPAPQHPCSWNTDIWRGDFSPKLRVFLWEIVKGALPLGENLEKRSILSNSKCIHCGFRKTATHLFLHCRFAASIWEMSPLLHVERITSATTFATVLKESKKTLNLPPSGLISGPLFPWICWTIWTSRNQLIFENKVFSPLETLTKAICLSREWQEAQLKGNTQFLSTQKLNQGINARNNMGGVSVYTDASWKEGVNKAGLGWLFKDHLGRTILT
ncbi:PREDICTED: uncharacterized protein LOC106330980 [Brassica oleracea var. oleracea]|uniref:uncharacterized protein LOC106330980 n=1 Tax=Brassica oleracea var. oleracea TaxID=109376 RepID=UPI0006A7268F|nr:PREDICTED: uncharacterized protein LOC106330980 [Brassica oleracea var. oleracea]